MHEDIISVLEEVDSSESAAEMEEKLGERARRIRETIESNCKFLPPGSLKVAETSKSSRNEAPKKSHR